jgi:hypothetical protein
MRKGGGPIRRTQKNMVDMPPVQLLRTGLEPVTKKDGRHAACPIAPYGT